MSGAVDGDRVRRRELGELELEPTVAHGGQGRILFNRLFGPDAFEGPIHFVDYAVLPPGSSIGLHRHGRDEELYLVLEGRGRMTRDGESFAVRAGSVVVNRAGGEHGLVNDSDADLRLFVVEVGLPGEAPA
ncbi:cupin domain-containing protein [Engelhardtia mirabilis]|uniref:Cupin domain protein n=1 Tax=Engelhardtia mirabilis TaxID=2528011 RepID=A0A518BFA6_9BACT|nr:Cupin domain protein [Planctomycetes bacterium Pla133]QDU99971.1 Cupin domain protein [Planctomycetes bacterium Pla86]